MEPQEFDLAEFTISTSVPSATATRHARPHSDHMAYLLRQKRWLLFDACAMRESVTEHSPILATHKIFIANYVFDPFPADVISYDEQSGMGNGYGLQVLTGAHRRRTFVQSFIPRAFTIS